VSDEERKPIVMMDWEGGNHVAMTAREYYDHMERELLAEAGVPASLLDSVEAPSTDTYLRDLLDHQERLLAPMRERWEAMVLATVPLIFAAMKGPRSPQRAGHPGGGRAARRRGEARKRRERYLWAKLVRACNAVAEARRRT
jgi:hypothetical protein